VSGNAFGYKVFENHLDLPTAANQTDVARPPVGQVKQRLLIVAVAASDNQAVGVRGDFQIGQNAVNRAAEAPLSPWKSLGRNELLPVIDNPNIKLQISRQVGHRLANVAAADDDESAARQRRQQCNSLSGV